MNLSNLTPAPGSRKDRIRIGRGPGSGKGGTSTKGHKGSQSRASYSAKEGFEGGQMPLQRRLPKFGFKNPFRVEFQAINLDRIQALLEERPDLKGQDLSPEVLLANGLISTLRKPFKVLGRGEISMAVTVYAHKFSDSATKAIETAGGKTIVIE